MDTLYIVMPAYNEESNIERVIDAWYPVLSGKNEDSRLVVADSGSHDKTHMILKQISEKYPKLEILEDTMKEHGPKVIALYKYAVDRGADYIFQTDSDGQTDPGEFAAFWNGRKNKNAIIGVRPVRGDGYVRGLVEKILCLILRLYFGVRIRDANAPFRLMKAEILKKYLHHMPSDYNLPNAMLTVYFVYFNESVEFREITFRARQGGVNSINIRKIMQIGWKALHDFWGFKKDINKVYTEKTKNNE